MEIPQLKENKKEKDSKLSDYISWFLIILLIIVVLYARYDGEFRKDNYLVVELCAGKIQEEYKINWSESIDKIDELIVNPHIIAQGVKKKEWEAKLNQLRN